VVSGADSTGLLLAYCVTSPAGTVTTFAGGSSGSTDGTGADARFAYPSGVAVDGDGNVYVADRSNHTIRKITPAGVVTTLAGAAGSYGSADGRGPLARFNRPVGVAVDGDGNLYVTDRQNHTIRKITPAD
jgi:glucose/arabinose dehydrogenase